MEWENLKSRNRFYLEMGMFSIGTVQVFDENRDNLLLYAKSRVFKWKGLKVFTDKDMQHEVMSIIQDFEKQKQGKSLGQKWWALYNITDTRQGQSIAQARYKFTSIWATNYDLLDAQDQAIGSIEQVGKIFLSRMLAFVQPAFEIKIQGKVVATLTGKWAWAKKKFYLDIVDPSADIRQILALCILILGMEKAKSAAT